MYLCIVADMRVGRLSLTEGGLGWCGIGVEPERFLFTCWFLWGGDGVSCCMSTRGALAGGLIRRTGYPLVVLVF